MKTIRYARKPTFANVWAERLTEPREFPTASGVQIGNPGDYVIDLGGEPGTSTAPYPCPADVFERTYQIAEPIGGTVPTEHILQFFVYAHLPAHLQQVSKPFADLANAIVLGDNVPESGTVTMGNPLPRNPERTVALRKLLEAKDAAVRALLAK